VSSPRLTDCASEAGLRSLAPGFSRQLWGRGASATFSDSIPQNGLVIAKPWNFVALNLAAALFIAAARLARLMLLLLRKEKIMNLILLIVVLVLLFGGGGFYWRSRRG
jgi:hypothetical protein